MEIRAARRKDVPAVVALLADDMLGREREAAPAGDFSRYYAAFDEMADDPGNILYVADADGVIVGCFQFTIIVGLSLSATRRAQIEGVRVAASRRGEGLGERLFAFAIEEAKRRGCGLVQLTTNRARGDAARFYERLGFLPTHTGYKLPL